MELSEFARKILYSTRMEDKLELPSKLTDEHPGLPVRSPSAPGRPRELIFKSSGTTSGDFPNIHRLEKESERGRLLHFFANHELLATELMALVLLRFPDAPAAFRQGILRTLREEQIHTQLYLDRMRECGVEFGSLPVSGYFWRSVSAMDSPLDYLAGLSLTFEQANLDFALQFSKTFAKVGDTASAQLLERIYRDEIAHVAYGLKWLRRWKLADQSDWEAYCQQLRFPLSPQRAKGTEWNAAGRRLAGLDESFIANLNVFSQSKGRTPDVYWFNPFSEAYIAQGTSFTPGKYPAQLSRDLVNLPQFLCRQDDVVLVPKRPDIAFLSDLKDAGIVLPEFFEVGQELDPQSDQSPALTHLGRRKLSRLRPWAWGPDSTKALAPLMGSVTNENRTPTNSFHPGIAQLYSKAWSARFLRDVVSEAHDDDQNWLNSIAEVGVEVREVEQTIQAIETIRERGHHPVVLKQSHGLAGGNAIRLLEPALQPAQRRWIEHSLAQGRTLVVEPWLERVADFSVQLEMGTDGLQILGYTGLINDLKGQFEANWAEPARQRRLPSALLHWIEHPRDFANRIHLFYEAIRRRLEGALKELRYAGPMGIDALIYRNSDGRCRVKPVVEINPRYTMGRLTLELMRFTTPGSHGMFQLLSLKQIQSHGFGNFGAYASMLRERFPVQKQGHPTARIAEGAIYLNDWRSAESCLAVFQVSRRAHRAR